MEHDLLVISDEAYEHLWFEDHHHIPIATLPGMWERTVTVGSGGKSFSFTGWKVGWAYGPHELIRAVSAVRQHLSFVSGDRFSTQSPTVFAFRTPTSLSFARTSPASGTYSATGLPVVASVSFPPKAPTS